MIFLLIICCFKSSPSLKNEILLVIFVYGYLTSALAAWDKLRLLETTFKAFLLEVFNKHDLRASISTIILYSSEN